MSERCQLAKFIHRKLALRSLGKPEYLLAMILGFGVVALVVVVLLPPQPEAKLKFFYKPAAGTDYQLIDWTPYEGRPTINADSLNERFDYALGKQAGIYRIVALGGTSTYGLYVDTPDNWTERLEDRLNETECAGREKFEVINLGVHGYDVQYSVERFRRRGSKYNPDLVIWLLSDEMIEQINEIVIQRNKVYEESLRDSGEFERLVAAGELYPAWRRALEDMSLLLTKEELLVLQQSHLGEFNQYYRGPLVIVALPNSQYKELLKEFVDTRTNTYFYDELTDLEEIPDAIFPQDEHPNEKGHKIIAEDIFAFLSKNKIVPCN